MSLKLPALPVANDHVAFSNLLMTKSTVFRTQVLITTTKSQGKLYLLQLGRIVSRRGWILCSDPRTTEFS